MRKIIYVKIAGMYITVDSDRTRKIRYSASIVLAFSVQTAGIEVAFFYIRRCLKFSKFWFEG